jgi:hypothetical protein
MILPSFAHTAPVIEPEAPAESALPKPGEYTIVPHKHHTNLRNEKGEPEEWREILAPYGFGYWYHQRTHGAGWRIDRYGAGPAMPMGGGLPNIPTHDGWHGEPVDLPRSCVDCNTPAPWLIEDRCFACETIRQTPRLTGQLGEYGDVYSLMRELERGRLPGAAPGEQRVAIASRGAWMQASVNPDDLLRVARALALLQTPICACIAANPADDRIRLYSAEAQPTGWIEAFQQLV